MCFFQIEPNVSSDFQLTAFHVFRSNAHVVHYKWSHLRLLPRLQRKNISLFQQGPTMGFSPVNLCTWILRYRQPQATSQQTAQVEVSICSFGWSWRATQERYFSTAAERSGAACYQKKVEGELVQGCSSLEKKEKQTSSESHYSFVANPLFSETQRRRQ